MSTPAPPGAPLVSQRPIRDEEQIPQWAIDLVRMVRSPVFLGVVFTALLVAAGIVVLGISGWAIYDQYYVALQLPYAVSGGFAGLGLMMTGVCLSSILGHRRDQAAEDDEMGLLLEDVTLLVRAGIRRRGRSRTEG
jgi:hypothetical protein